MWGGKKKTLLSNLAFSQTALHQFLFGEEEKKEEEQVEGEEAHFSVTQQDNERRGRVARWAMPYPFFAMNGWFFLA